MSTLLEKASLVMIPSGYKEDVVYSQIPTDGSGDLSFTRASDGTRINSAGLVEVVPWNLVTYSEDLTNGAWLLASATIGANATTAPNGTTTAESFTSLATLANHVVYQLLSGVSGAYTFSVYVKKANSRYVYIKLVGNASQWVAAVFDLDDGTLTKSEATGWTGLTASSESVGNGWYRLIVSGSGATSVNFNVGIQYTNTGTPTFSAYADASFTGTGTIDYYIWGAQLNIGSTAKPYFPTTDRLNVPRLTYQNGGGGCPSLLLEKQSTNLLIYSNTSDWGLSPSITKTQNTTDLLSPDGTNNATKIVQSAGTGDTSLGFSIADGAITFSFWGRVASGTKTLVVDLRNNSGTVTSLSPVLTTEWQRFTLTNATAGTGSSGAVWIYPNGAGTFYIWGVQAEVGSYSTSTILTNGASATRVADAASKTGISSLIGQTEGTLFLDFVFSRATDSFGYFAIQNASATSRVRVTYTSSSNTMQLDLVIGGSASVINTFNPVDGTRYKIAIGYKSADSVAYRNGVQVGTQAATFTYTDLSILTYDNPAAAGTQVISGRHNQTLLFPTRLSNTELAQLTTL